MKKILVSWYGITDLRASLGWEPCGPFIAAMRAGHYDEVHVLQYVEKEKTAPAEEIDGVSLGLSSECSSADFINRICNTPEANDHFMNWLKAKAEMEGMRAAIHSHEVYLKHLNDTNGIYSAAIAVLDKVVAQDVQITLNISPGTATMAFSWAFAALRYPGTEIRLITSPRASCPPEVVELPEGVRQRHERADFCPFPKDGEQLDTLYHLFGKQRMPSLLGVLQFPARHHVFVTTRDFPADVMKNFVPEDECEQIVTDAFEAATLIKDVEEHLSAQPRNAKIGFNLTGGTKIMYVCALELCRTYGVLPVYFDIANDRVVNLQDYSVKANTVRISLPQIIHLNSRTILQDCANSGIPQPDEQRTRLCNMLMKHQAILRESYAELNKHSDPPSPFAKIGTRKMEMELQPNGKARIKFPTGQEMRFPKFPTFAKYLSGGWFEEYVYHEVKMLLGSSSQYDVRLNMELRARNSRPGEIYQELDVVFTDGKRLYIIECKAGKVWGEYINKLSSIIKSYGGVSGGAILCYVGNTPGHTVCQKALAEGIQLWHIDYLRKGLRDLLKL